MDQYGIFPTPVGKTGIMTCDREEWEEFEESQKQHEQR